MKKTNKIISLLVAAVLLIGLSSGLFTSSAAATLAVGDYVEFGMYQGNAILWRVINVDTYGALLFSEKILTLKAADAAEKGENLEQDYPNVGNNYYPTSNIRDWLNSSSQTVSYTTNAPDVAYVENGLNAYADEPGFLYEFTDAQRAMINTSNQLNALDNVSNRNITNKTGAELLKYDSSISGAKANYSDCYRVASTEKVFLLDVRQFSEYVVDRGFDIAKYPTYTAVRSSEYRSDTLSVTKPYKYWLRTPRTEDNSSFRVNYFGNYILDDTAWNSTVGVAPALYIAADAPQDGGSGSAGDPIVISGSAQSFTDVGGTEAEEAINALAYAGAVTGYSDGTFKPCANISRGDFVLMLMRALGQNNTIARNFDDVPEGSYYYNAIGQARLRTYVGGDGTGNFYPDNTITIEDMYVIGARALGIKNSQTLRYEYGFVEDYLDYVNISSYALAPISYLVKEGVVGGGSGSLYPKTFATRADCALFIYNLLSTVK